MIQDTRDYITESERQLPDRNFYQKVSEDLTILHTSKVNTYLEGLGRAGELNKKLLSGVTTSALTDILLSPLVPNLPSYPEDTQHFLEIMKEKGSSLPPNTLLCTLDVNSLYANIPNEEGRRAAAFWLSEFRPQVTIPQMEPSNSSLLSLLKMLLK